MLKSEHGGEAQENKPSVKSIHKLTAAAGDRNSAPTRTRDEHVLESLISGCSSPCVITADSLNFGEVEPAHHFSLLSAAGACAGFLRFMSAFKATASSALVPKDERNHLRNTGGPSQP